MLWFDIFIYFETITIIKLINTLIISQSEPCVCVCICVVSTLKSESLSKFQV